MDELATQPSGPRQQAARVLEAVVRSLAARDTRSAQSSTQQLPAWMDTVLQAAAEAADNATLRLLPLAAAQREHAQLSLSIPASADQPLVLLVDAPPAAEPAAVATWEPVALLLCLALRESRRRAELEAELSTRLDQLDEQRRFIERIIDSMPVGLYVVDRAYRIQAWNHKRETGLQGVARDRALGKTIFEVLHRQPAALLKREFDEVFASGRMQQFQMESEATGSVRTYRLSKIPMRIDEMRPSYVTHVITVGEDITDWRAALDRTAQSEKLAALGQMATGVMHEINNPLATIAACAETLQLQAEDSASSPGVPQGDPTELLRIIDLEVQRCKRIVHGLLDFARPKPVAHDELELNAVVRQTLFLLQHHPRRKQVSLVTELEEGTGLLARGDADRLVQVLMALVLNALDASTPGARVVLRSASVRVGTNTCSAIDVIDEGHGIPRESLSKVFEPFYTTKAPGSGTGLGLSICYGIVMEHGGVLAVDSALGHGATFRMLLPASGAPPLTLGAGVPPLVHTPIGTAA